MDFKKKIVKFNSEQTLYIGIVRCQDETWKRQKS